MPRLAWLNADMDGDLIKKKRSEQYDDNHPLKKLPTVKIAPYILKYAMDVGLFKVGSMGLTPIDWPDLLAWSSMTNINPHPEESRIIRELSQVYVAWSSKAKDPNCGAPYLSKGQEQANKQAKSDNIKAQMAQFRKNRNG